MGSAEIKSNELSNRNVVISNYVARSAQTLSLSEKRILMAGIAQLGGVNAEVVLSAQRTPTPMALTSIPPMTSSRRPPVR